MIVVSDTSPLNYLILIGQDHILPALFGQVFAPPAVVAELKRSKASALVGAWADNPPAWLEVRAPRTVPAGSELGPGETEALALAQELQADVLLIDERDGVAAAKRLNLFVTGTLGVLTLAAEKGLLSFADAISALRRTTFRAPEKLIEELLRRDTQRRAEETSQNE